MKTKYDEDRKQRYTSIMIPPALKKIISSIDYSKLSKTVEFSNVTSASVLLKKGLIDVLASLNVKTFEDLQKRDLLLPEDKRKQKPGPKKK